MSIRIQDRKILLKEDYQRLLAYVYIFQHDKRGRSEEEYNLPLLPRSSVLETIQALIHTLLPYGPNAAD